MYVQMQSAIRGFPQRKEGVSDAGQRPSSPLDAVLEGRDNCFRAAAGDAQGLRVCAALGYEYARHWARFHHGTMPDGTAEDQTEGYLNKALMHAMDGDKWR
jgi:hypothetical protein